MSTEYVDAEPRPEKSGCSGCLLGCVVGAAVMLLVLFVAGWWLSNNWRGLAGSFASSTLEAIIDDAELPAEEKAQLKEQVQRVTTGFAEGSITDQQMQRIMTGVMESPLITTFMVRAVETKYLDRSGLSDEEKADAKVSLQRYASGLIREQIPEESIDQVMVHIADKDQQGQWQLRDQVTDEQLRAFVDAAKQAADEAGVAQEIEPVDPSDELRRIIDQALAPPQRGEQAGAPQAEGAQGPEFPEPEQADPRTG